MVEAVLFILMAAAALAGAVTVVMARNPVYSGIGLLGTMLALAVLYAAQLAHFVAAVQVIVYAGAVMTLFLFVIMLIGVDKSEDTSETLPRQRLMVGVLAGVTVLIGLVVAISGNLDWVPAAAGPEVPEATNGSIQAVAGPLFGEWVLAVQVTALLLTIAAAGAIALAMYRRPSQVATADD